MQDRIKTIITASWTTAVERTELNIREIFASSSDNLIGNYFSGLESNLAPKLSKMSNR